MVPVFCCFSIHFWGGMGRWEGRGGGERERERERGRERLSKFYKISPGTNLWKTKHTRTNVRHNIFEEL